MKSAVGVSLLNKQHLVTSASIIFKPSMVLLYHCHWHQFGPQSFTPHKISLCLRVLVSNLSSRPHLWCESESVTDSQGTVSSQRTSRRRNWCNDHKWIRSSHLNDFNIYMALKSGSIVCMVIMLIIMNYSSSSHTLREVQSCFKHQGSSRCFLLIMPCVTGYIYHCTATNVPHFHL